ncbi:MAG: DUF559 domain-containing protein [Novosphingobium sp.]|nr:DUF559 domain-containing protein [Novosphingobium sp.]
MSIAAGHDWAAHRALESQGYRVVRFFAADVLKSPVDVAQAIIGICQQPQ